MGSLGYCPHIEKTSEAIIIYESMNSYFHIFIYQSEIFQAPESLFLCV